MAREVHNAVVVRSVLPDNVKSSVTCSEKFGRRSFPTRNDYIRAIEKDGNTSKGIEESAELAAGVMRHWHTTGQTGCLFARMLGRQATGAEWPTAVVVCDDNDEYAQRQISGLREVIGAAIVQPEVQLLSLVFPRIVSVEGLKRLTCDLSDAGVIDFFEDRALSEHVRIAGRVDIGSGVLAWVMAFGPFSEWPPTRRGPLLELVVRTKPKGPGLFEKLNQDPGVAHLADIDLGLSTPHTSRLFEQTEKSTRDVLGGEPDEISAAKTTFSFPASSWNAAQVQALPVGRLSSSRLI